MCVCVCVCSLGMSFKGNFLCLQGPPQWSRDLMFCDQDMTLHFATTCPVGQVKFIFHLAYSNFHLLLKNVCFIILHSRPSRVWCLHVKAYFLGQAWTPDYKTCTLIQK